MRDGPDDEPLRSDNERDVNDRLRLKRQWWYYWYGEWTARHVMEEDTYEQTNTANTVQNGG